MASSTKARLKTDLEQIRDYQLFKADYTGDLATHRASETCSHRDDCPRCYTILEMIQEQTDMITWLRGHMKQIERGEV